MTMNGTQSIGDASRQSPDRPLLDDLAAEEREDIE
jgi:hypothetical protein